MTSSVLGSVVSAVSMAGMMLPGTMETATTEPWEQVDALDDGRAFVDRSEDRMLQSSAAPTPADGSATWSPPTSRRSGPGSSVRSLLLTPTGRIRADMWIAQHR